ncbi:tRNA-dihydrouridine synthase, putative [Plasmodium vinckei]|uniref:tRNA-dihydrouridine synthase n=2 Tax=Plasmodium vinckei TaxID=5860 RepID=W7AP74_PLAVN|nr:tRNA-dihydrouridine synthase 4 [Plasmodium vinckei petteri]CAD2107396.1 tRNA-dihydrouridine synthase, putative [Plasmodium vinckei petteri]CAD2107487.1 tRNA-dihydrouridine synthase, putative [Plasmodium vinckei]
MDTEQSENVKKKEYEKTYWEILGNPKYVLAPMVDLSELPFRLLCRNYNCDLAFTPMLHSKNFVEHSKYRIGYFKKCDQDKPLIAQFCGNDPSTILKAIDYIKDDVNGVDINLGCPQQIAKKGNYGAFLLHKHDEVVNLISDITNNCNVPISCKIRKIDNDYQKTLNLCYDLQSRNVKMITVHGRTKEEKGVNIKECDYEIIKIIKERLNIPIIANGSIENFEDIEKCLNYTKTDAVMCAEIMLEKPSFFSNKNINTIDLVNEYYDLFLKYETNTKYLKSHLFKMLYKYFTVHTDLRDLLNNCHTINDYLSFRDLLNQKRNENSLVESAHSWYRRYRKN